MSSTYVFLFAICAILGLTVAYPSGAPEETCSIFTANHTGHLPQQTRAPFELIANPSSISHGGSIKVTLQGANGETFKGFFIQGQDKTTKQPVGKFQGQSDAQTRDCSGPGSANAITHVSAAEKSQVVVNWQAPSSYQGTVVFRAVVVKTYEQFWNRLFSNELTVA